MVTSFDVLEVLQGHPVVVDACTEGVRRAVAESAGVTDAALTQVPDGLRLVVVHDATVANTTAIRRLLEEAAAEVVRTHRHVPFQLGNLHSADRAKTVERAVAHLPGVEGVRVSYGAERLDVTFDATAVSRAQIAAVMAEIGCDAEPISAGGTWPFEAAREHPADERQEEGAVVSRAPVGAEERPARRWPPGGIDVPVGLALSLAAGASLLAGWCAGLVFGAPEWLRLVFYGLAYGSGGWEAARHGVRAARRGHFDVDLLMLVAAAGAASLGAWPEGALLLFLFSLGHALEHVAMERARHAIRALGELTPRTATVREGGLERGVPVERLEVGDVVVVRAGERLPSDGEVLEGRSGVDQAPITGESMPVLKGPGDRVFAGSINGDGRLLVRTTRLASDSTLARVIALVEQAQAAKSPTQRFTERFERVFVPVVLVVTGLVIVVPPLAGVPFGTSFLRAMTLLVAASPCALALATPSAVLAGIARAARSGVLIKGGAHLEHAGTARVVAFDKTGTLTSGRPVVTDVWSVPGVAEGDVVAVAAAVESGSSHPLGRAVRQEASRRGAAAGLADTVVAHPGSGVVGMVDGHTVRVGTEDLLTGAGLRLPQEATERAGSLRAAGKTVMFVAHDDRVRGVMGVRDQPRPAVREVIAALRCLGIERTVMLTGDHPDVARAIARELGIDDVRAGLLPEDKAEAVRELERTFGRVAMVGDGVNDAPAMALSTVGIAMGGAGTDVALETADIALMADDLGRLPYAVALSRASRRTIVQNLVVSLGVIGVLVVTSLTGVVGIALAIVVHEGSTVAVVVNALRLLGFRERLRAPCAPPAAGPRPVPQT